MPEANDPVGIVAVSDHEASVLTAPTPSRQPTHSSARTRRSRSAPSRASRRRGARWAVTAALPRPARTAGVRGRRPRTSRGRRGAGRPPRSGPAVRAPGRRATCAGSRRAARSTRAPRGPGSADPLRVGHVVGVALGLQPQLAAAVVAHRHHAVGHDGRLARRQLVGHDVAQREVGLVHRPHHDQGAGWQAGLHRPGQHGVRRRAGDARHHDRRGEQGDGAQDHHPGQHEQRPADRGRRPCGADLRRARRCE